MPAATGASDTLAVALGGFKNQNATTISRVLTLQALSPLPAGASPLTVTASLAADPVSGAPADHRGELQRRRRSRSRSHGDAHRRRQAPAQRDGQDPAEQRLPGQQRRCTRATLTLTVTYPGYSGTFLSYAVPVSVWDGNGAGP